MIEVIQGNTFEHLSKFPEESFDAVISDPPYDLTEQQMQHLLVEFRRVCPGTIVVFCAPENQWPKSDQYAFWTKPISTKNTSKKYSRFVEVIQIYQGPKSKWNPGRNWSNYVNVFPDFLEATAIHPYQKPVSLMERLVLNHTAEGDRIIDPFCGSGTTLVACKRNGRHCVGIEQNSDHAANAIRRTT